MVTLLDPFDAPSGRETITNLPAWRARNISGQRIWVFIEQVEGQLYVSGYPQHPVVNVSAGDAAGGLVGLGAGAALGFAVGGPPGAFLGGLLGMLMGAGAKRK